MDAAAGDQLNAPQKKPTTFRLWLVWLVLSISCYGGFFAVMIMPPVYGFTMRGFVDTLLFNRIMPAIGMAALLAPIAGIFALILRVWRPLALSLIAFCAVSLIAYASYVDYQLDNRPPLGNGFEDVGRD